MEITVLGSGSSGNCAILRGAGTAILVDAGLSARTTLARLAQAGFAPSDIDGILLTHEHGDHARGLPVLLRTLRCPVFATRLTAEDLQRSDQRNASADWTLFSTGSTFNVGGLEVTAFSVPHDAADPVGFTIRESRTSLAVLTDLGHVNSSVVHHISGVSCLFVEANHDEKLLHADTKRPFSVKQRILSPHGHLSNNAAAELAALIFSDALSHVILGHLSRDCNTPDLAVAAVRGSLDGADVTVFCAEQDVAMPTILLES